ncbi:hypothetical protein [Robertmurraya sp.]|uniref:hypothetical protein n=1 Tax=Robertmurraya sp. TaxID=2837525 RepID=UPI003704178E
MFDKEEILSWEMHLNLRKTIVKIKNYKDPRTEKLRNFRKGLIGCHYDEESKAERKPDYRRYRNQMKQFIRCEKYELVRKYQKTSGWLTW